MNNGKYYNHFVKFDFARDWISPWRSYLAEFLGTYIFVLLASSAAIVAADVGNVQILLTSVAIGMGLIVAMYTTVHLSGAHLNPAVTLAIWLAQKISSTLAFFYITSQILASFAAALTVWAVFGQRVVESGLGGPTIGEEVSLPTALSIEAIATSILVFVYFATMVDRKGPASPASLGGPASFGPLVVGLAVLVLAIIALPISGAALNPARAVGPAVLANSYVGLLVWVTGPALGSLVGLLYDFVFLRRTAKNR